MIDRKWVVARPAETDNNPKIPSLKPENFGGYLLWYHVLGAPSEAHRENSFQNKHKNMENAPCKSLEEPAAPGNASSLKKSPERDSNTQCCAKGPVGLKNEL